MCFQRAIYAGCLNLAADARDIQRTVDQLDLIETHSTGNRQRIFHAGGIVVRSRVPRLITVAVFSANREVVLTRIDLDACLVETVFGVRALDGVYLDFVSLPGGDVHIAVDIVEFNATVRRNGVRLMKFLGERATVGGMRPQGQDH